jgi:hypothetical protein
MVGDVDGLVASNPRAGHVSHKWPPYQAFGDASDRISVKMEAL